MKQRHKVMLVLSLLLFLGVVSYFFSHRYVSQQLNKQHQLELVEEANVLLYATDISDWSKALPTKEKQILEEISLENNQRISIISPEGVLIYDSDPESDTDLGDNLATRPEVADVLKSHKVGSDIRQSATLNHNYFYVAIPVMTDNQLIGILRLSEKADGFMSNINQFKKLIISLLILFSVLVILMMANVWWTQKRRETELTQVLSGIQKGEYTDKYLLTDNGQLSALGMTVRDLAEELEQQHQEFHMSEQRFEELLAVLNIGVMVIAQNRKILRVNPIAREVLGVSGNQLTQDYHHYLPGVDLYEQVEQTFDTNQPFSEKKEWQQRWYKIKGNSILNDHQQQVIVLLYDITDVQNVIVHQNDFISNISHELKTPVTAIKGFSESLMDGAKDIPELNSEFLGIINQESLRLEKLIDEILDLAAVSGNRQQIITEIDLVAVCQNLQKQHHQLISDKNLTVVLQSPDTLLFNGQPEKIQKIFDNIFTNSLKYTHPQGSVKMSIEDRPSDIKFEVVDNGMGIPEADLTRIYERFYRVDKARTSQIKGTGLGLSIVKEIVSDLHGKMVITSEENKWTKVVVILPKRVD